LNTGYIFIAIQQTEDDKQTNPLIIQSVKVNVSKVRKSL